MLATIKCLCVSIALVGKTDAFVSNRLVDVGFVVDVSGSFGDDVAAFKAQATAIVSDISLLYPNAHFGLATFQDFPLQGWGDSDDVPHARITDLVPGDASFLNAVNSLSTSGGGDGPESQLVSLYQAITGEGLVVPPSVGDYTIPAGLNFNFRPDSARILLLWTDETFHTPSSTPGYPGPSVEDVIAVATMLNSRRHLSSRDLQVFGSDAVRIVGIVSVDLAKIPSPLSRVPPSMVTP